MFCRRAVRRLADARWLVATGHYGWPVPLVVAVGMRLMPTLAWAYALTPLRVAGLVPVAVHAGGICPRCARGMTPACPTGEVERARTALAWVHRPLRHPATWAVLAAHLVVSFGFGGVYGRWSAVTVIVAFAGGMWALRRHARLRPWCPWCSGGGGGDEDLAPAPDGPGGLSVDPARPVRPSDGPAEEPAEVWTVADLQAGWAAHPAPAEPARPGVRPGRAGVPGQRAGGAW
jgi:hypothetical protein